MDSKVIHDLALLFLSKDLSEIDNPAMLKARYLQIFKELQESTNDIDINECFLK